MNEVPTEAGFRCNCQGCYATKEHPCESAEELTTLRARVRELEGLVQSMHPENAPKDLSLIHI